MELNMKMRRFGLIPTSGFVANSANIWICRHHNNGLADNDAPMNVMRNKAQFKASAIARLAKFDYDTILNELNRHIPFKATGVNKRATH